MPFIRLFPDDYEEEKKGEKKEIKLSEDKQKMVYNKGISKPFIRLHNDEMEILKV